MNEKTTVNLSPFWTWVAALPIADDPRGDFLQETHDLIQGGTNPEDREGRMGGEVRDIYDGLRREFDAEVAEAREDDGAEFLQVSAYRVDDRIEFNVTVEAWPMLWDKPAIAALMWGAANAVRIAAEGFGPPIDHRDARPLLQPVPTDDEGE